MHSEYAVCIYVHALLLIYQLTLLELSVQGHSECKMFTESTVLIHVQLKSSTCQGQL